MIILRPYQANGVREIFMGWRRGVQSMLYCLPTGGGKTICFSYIASEVHKVQKRVVILVHRKELVEQIRQALQKFNVYAGVQNPDYKPDYSARVQVASVQTIVNRLHLNQSPDYVVIDEAHHGVAAQFRDVLSQWPDAKILGVTATPCRGDGIGLGRHVGGIFDEMVLGPSVKELISMGQLSRYELYCPGDIVEVSDLPIGADGEIVRNALAERVGTQSIIGDQIDHYLKYSQGGNARCCTFCVNVAHAEKVAQQYRDAGIRSTSIDGTLDRFERKRRIDDFGTGQIQVLTSCDLIGEGFDLPAIEIVQQMRHINSLGLNIQQTGRGLRIAPGKTKCIILDHVGNVLRHGPPDRDRDWTLDGEEKGARRKRQLLEAEQLMRCTRCYASFDHAPQCPVCGHMEARREIKVKAGDLVQWSGEAEESAAVAARSKEQRAAERLDNARRKSEKEAETARRVALLLPRFKGKVGADLRKEIEQVEATVTTLGELHEVAAAIGYTGKDKNRFVIQRARLLNIPLPFLKEK